MFFPKLSCWKFVVKYFPPFKKQKNKRATLKMNASSMYGVPLSISEAWAHIAVEENQKNIWAKSRGIASRTIPNEHTVWGDVQTLIRKINK